MLALRMFLVDTDVNVRKESTVDDGWALKDGRRLFWLIEVAPKVCEDEGSWKRKGTLYAFPPYVDCCDRKSVVFAKCRIMILCHAMLSLSDLSLYYSEIDRCTGVRE